MIWIVHSSTHGIQVDCDVHFALRLLGEKFGFTSVWVGSNFIPSIMGWVSTIFYGWDQQLQVRPLVGSTHPRNFISG